MCSISSRTKMIPFNLILLHKVISQNTKCLIIILTALVVWKFFFNYLLSISVLICTVMCFDSRLIFYCNIYMLFLNFRLNLKKQLLFLELIYIHVHNKFQNDQSKSVMWKFKDLYLIFDLQGLLLMTIFINITWTDHSKNLYLYICYIYLHNYVRTYSYFYTRTHAII